MSNEEKILSYISSLNIQTSRQKPSEWAEMYRVVTSGSNHKGKWSYNLTPYTRELVDRLSPEDPMRVLVLMAGSQLGKSHGFIFNGIGYIIKNRPTNILLTCGDDDLVKDSMTKIDEVIQNSGLKHLIRPNVIKKSNQKSGDTDRVKEFVGGMLIAQSIKAPDKIKQNSYEIIFLDDIESAVRSNSKNVGDIIDLAFARATSYNDTYKICLVGVPELKHNSIIEPAFLKGDQRHYHMPCPLCGDYIRIIWYEKIEGENNEHAGVVFKKDETGRLIESSVGYVCQNCHGFFKENHKQEMLMNGKWIASAKSMQPNWLSYHLPALIAPRGFFNWNHYAHEWLSIFPNSSTVIEKKLHHFKNHVLAETYEQKGKSVKIIQLLKNIRGYKIGIVPTLLCEKDGNGRIVMLSCVCDLNGFIDDARLDYEVIAHAENGVTYSVDSGSIGTFQRGLSKENRELFTYKNNEPNNVWSIFLNNILQKSYSSDSGKSFNVFCAGIDTGNFTIFAYSFILSCQMLTTPLFVCGLKGDRDKVKRHGFDSPNYHKSKEQDNLYLLEPNQLKDQLADRLELEWSEDSGLQQPLGFMNYPQPEDGKYTIKNYFSHFESEHKVSKLNADGSEIGFTWDKKHSTVANHFWDVRYYDIALREIFVDVFCKAAGVKDPTWSEYVNLIKRL